MSATLFYTSAVETEASLRELFSMDSDEELQPNVYTHDGCWRCEGLEWRFWKYEDADEEASR